MVCFSEEVAVSMNFHADWTGLLREALESMGYSSVSQADGRKVCCAYFNVARRRIAPKPRRIRVSKEFSCPADCLPGLQLLEDKVRSGQDLRPHLSRKIPKLNFDDLILNDWGIHHFHLGVTYDNEGLIQGTPYILLARVTDGQFYMIDVVKHKLWHHRGYVEILHRNWPRSIERWKCNGVLGLSDPPDDEAVKILRPAHVNCPIQTEDGTVYLPMGGGYATSGMSVEAVQQCLLAERLLEMMETAVKKQGKEILLRERREERIACSSFHFRLELRSDGVYVVDQQAPMTFRLGDRRDSRILYGHPSLPLRLSDASWSQPLRDGGRHSPGL